MIEDFTKTKNKKEKIMELAILNTSIITSEGVFSLRDISLEEARKLADKGNCTGNLEKIVIK